ncbi:hypothetical protein KC331_g9046 [Hortaea werneckii]|nr:hypothetical protein KC331_g9046 [Hortaea werneckii]KAI7708172.1 hypothetical protein KC353_g11191 [Hortaea werneckii]
MDHSSTPQDDLDSMWMDFVKELDKVEGTQYTRSSHVITSVKDVEARLDKLQLQKSDSGARAKEGILRSLQCVQSLGQIASKGATIAFGPAEACFGAANLVIDGLRDSLKVFENLPELFSRMSAFLVMLDEKMPDSGHPDRESRVVREACYAVLRQYLRALTFIHRATSSKLERFKASVKAFFFRENEANFHLAEMDKLVGHFIQSVTVETNSGVNRLVNDQFLEGLQKALGLASSNDVADNMRLHRDIGLQLVPDSGKWMLESDGFQQWADPDKNPSHAMFAISDVKQTGKTFLSHRIVQHLQDSSHLASKPSTVVAYFYFPSQSSDTWPIVDNTLVSLAMRNVAFQIASADQDFASRLSAESGRNVDLYAPTSLWRILFDYSRNSKTTYFIILDSLFPTTPDPSQLFIDIARDLSTSTEVPPRSQPARLRLLLSGRPAFFQSFETLPPKHQFIRSRFAHINDRRNAPDLRLLIDYRLMQSNLPETILQQIKNVAVQVFPAVELYPRLTGLLDAICKEHRLNKITALLKRAQATAHQEPIDAVEARIASVNNEPQSLINELNAILAWFIVLGTEGKLPLKLLNQAIMLHDKHIDDVSSGLLEQRIRNDHHHFLGIKKSVDETYVRIWDNLDVEGYINRQERVAKEGNALSKGRRDQPTTSAPPCLPEDKVEKVRQRLKNLFLASTYDQFGFDAFLDSKLDSVADNRDSKFHVRLGRNQALVRVVRTCLDAICYHTTDHTFHLVHEFATHSLTSHLHSIDLEKMGKEPKKGIGLKSLQLFHDRKVMSGWWTKERVRRTEIGEFCEAVARLWRDEDVAVAIEEFEGDKDLALAVVRNEMPVSSLVDAILKVQV